MCLDLRNWEWVDVMAGEGVEACTSEVTAPWVRPTQDLMPVGSHPGVGAEPPRAP